MKMSKNCSPQAIQDMDGFVSSLEQIWRNVALHYLLKKVLKDLDALNTNSHLD